ncbi:MAG TPA: glycosyltransferase family 4 protein [Candidatus Acidoferrum sp.]|nr:glycosyltransferase family 4 protein [Candidatus Acidoferrum sp.]
MQFIYHHRTMGRSSQAMHIRSMVEALKADGHKVTIVSPPGVDPLESAGMMPFLRKADQARGFQRVWKYISCQCPQFVFEILEILYNLFLPFRLFPILWRQPNAVLYERHAYFMFMGVFLGKWLRRPVVLEVNELAGFTRARGLIMERLARRIDAWVFSRASHILCVSSVLAGEAKQRGARSEKVHVVPNAIDPNRFRSTTPEQSLRSRLGLEGSIVIGHVGLFYRWDRLDVLIEAARNIRDRHPEIKVLLVGDGPEMENLKRTSFRLGMESAIIFSGPVPRAKVASYIDAMDICVLPDSNAFGSPIALFEFMAMGKPCVVPDLGPMRDIIEDLLTGIMFPHGDHAALEKALLGLTEDSVLRFRIGARAKQAVFERHTWAANARFLVQLAAGESVSRPLGQLKQADCDTH